MEASCNPQKQKISQKQGEITGKNTEISEI